MTTFADQLFEDLMAEYGDALTASPTQARAAAQGLTAAHGSAATQGPRSAQGAPTAQGPAAAQAPARGRLSRPLWASVGTLAAASAAAVGFTVFGGTASAYAVSDNHDGSYTVKVSKPSGIAGANSELVAMRSRVAVVQAKPGCPSIETFAVGGKGDVQVGKGTDPGTITVSASGLPADETALVVYTFDDGKPTAGMVPIKGRAPSCVSLPTTPPPGGVVTGDHGAGARSDTGSGDAPQG